MTPEAPEAAEAPDAKTIAAINEAVGALDGPGCVVWSSFQNLAPYRRVVGDQADELIRCAQRELGRLGTTVVVNGNDGVDGRHLATVASASEGEVIDELRPLAWLGYGLIGLTEAWVVSTDSTNTDSSQSAKSKVEKLVAARIVELACGLRFGIAAFDRSSEVGNADSLLEKARASCEEQKADKRGITRHGFPALWPERFRTLVHVSDPTCPSCSHIATEVIGSNTCSECGAQHQRERGYLVGGRLIRGSIL